MLDQQTLKQRLHYDPETGIFIRLKVEGALNQHLIGKQAGRINTRGHRQIRIDGRPYMAHQLAWLYMTGSWPELQVDHRDNNKDNNRFDNLRLATGSQNLANTPAPKTNTTGFKGVTYVRKLRKFKAQIRQGGKHTYLGLFEKAEDAGAAYLAAAKQLYGEFARA